MESNEIFAQRAQLCHKKYTVVNNNTVKFD